MLRSRQLAEDAGPMAHPIRPDSYIKMDNFYTVTVYEKGAEVIRMYQTLLGKDGFRKGIDEYFKRHDGQAVTCDDFRAAMGAANGMDLSGLEKWYLQAGTPNLSITPVYDAGAQTLTLKCEQSTPATPGQPNKSPVPIPIKMGLVGPDGKDLPVTVDGESKGTETVLLLDTAAKTFTLTNVPANTVPSLLRTFSAPVRMTVVGQSESDLTHLFANDSDPFNRWEAGQRLATDAMLRLYAAALKAGGENLDEDALEAILTADGAVTPAFLDAFKSTLNSKGDHMLISNALSLPAQSELVGVTPEANPIVMYSVAKYVKKRLAQHLEAYLEATLDSLDAAHPASAKYVFSTEGYGVRRLRSTCLSYLSALKKPEQPDALLARYHAATNMTDVMACLGALNDQSHPARETAMTAFYDKFKEEPLVLLKWLSLQAMSDKKGNLANLNNLLTHPAFSMANPNKCYSLIGGFAASPTNFHQLDGSGYTWLADQVIKLNGINAQVASRMVGPFTRWKKYDAVRQGLMKAQLERIMATEGLSDNLFEIVSKSLE